MRLLGTHAAPVTDLAWSPDGRLLASSMAGPSLPEGPVIWVWSVDDGQLAHVIDESAAFADDRTWRAGYSREDGLALNVHPGLSYLAFSPNGDLFASHFRRLIRLDLRSSQREEIGIGGTPLQITRDGRFLLCGASALWDTSAWKLLPGPLEGKWDGDYIDIKSAGLAPDGSWYVWCSATPEEKYDPCEIQMGLSDPLTGATLELVSTERRSHIPSRLVLDTAGDRIFTREIEYYLPLCTAPQRLAVWTRRKCWNKKTLGLTVQDFAVTPDGRKLIAIQDGLLLIKTLDRDAAPATIDCNAGGLTALCLSPDGQAAAVGSQTGVTAIVSLQQDL